jgi:GAF domain-containing protein
MNMSLGHGNLAEAFADLAAELQFDRGSPDTLQSIVHSAARIVPGARWAGISLVDGEAVMPKVPTSPAVAELDQMQSELNDGPCLTSLRGHRTVLVDDMRTDPRWPRYVHAARQQGFLSLLSFRLFVEGNTLGALNIYSDKSCAFTADSIVQGMVLAQHAAVAMIGAAAESQFEAGLATRDIIGEAEGILMHWMDLTRLQAFRLLTRLSQKSDTKLVEIARLVVEHHRSKVKPANS